MLEPLDPPAKMNPIFKALSPRSGREGKRTSSIPNLGRFRRRNSAGPGATPAVEEPQTVSAEPAATSQSLRLKNTRTLSMGSNDSPSQRANSVATPEPAAPPRLAPAPKDSPSSRPRRKFGRRASCPANGGSPSSRKGSVRSSRTAASRQSLVAEEPGGLRPAPLTPTTNSSKGIVEPEVSTSPGLTYEELYPSMHQRQLSSNSLVQKQQKPRKSLNHAQQRRNSLGSQPQRSSMGSRMGEHQSPSLRAQRRSSLGSHSNSARRLSVGSRASSHIESYASPRRLSMGSRASSMGVDLHYSPPERTQAPNNKAEEDHDGEIIHRRLGEELHESPRKAMGAEGVAQLSPETPTPHVHAPRRRRRMSNDQGSAHQRSPASPRPTRPQPAAPVDHDHNPQTPTSSSRYLHPEGLRAQSDPHVPMPVSPMMPKLPSTEPADPAPPSPSHVNPNLLPETPSFMLLSPSKVIRKVMESRFQQERSVEGKGCDPSRLEPQDTTERIDLDEDGEEDEIVEVVEDEEEATVVDVYPHPLEAQAPTQKLSRLYEYARACQWDMVVEECKANPRDANCVCERDGTTALHLAVMSRSNPVMRDGGFPGYESAPPLVIEALLTACPEAAIHRCFVKRYTPLSYACLVADENYDMTDAAEMVSMILRHAPQSAYVFTDDGFSALDVHILSYSRVHKERGGEAYSGGRSSAVVLRALLQDKPVLAEARTYRNNIRGPVELLYRCNMMEFKDAVEGDMNLVDSPRNPQSRTTVASKLSEWWAWQWVILLLKHAAMGNTDYAPPVTKSRPFCAVQAAARLVACPLPILSLAISMYPKQVESRDPRDDLYNMPLHEVSSWQCNGEILSGDPFIVRRKAKAIELLLDEYAEAARTTNNMGETPLQLAIESGTTWHAGLEMLVHACPKALKFPRKLRKRTDDQPNALSVSYHSHVVSVCCDEEEQDGKPDPFAPMEGMYPFLIAAILGRLPKSKRRAPSYLFEDQSPEELKRQLDKHDLESLRTVYGLLRAKPENLARFRSDVRKAHRKSMSGVS